MPQAGSRNHVASASGREHHRAARQPAGTVFRFQLALRINVLASEFLDREVLLQGVLSAHLAFALTADDCMLCRPLAIRLNLAISAVLKPCSRPGLVRGRVNATRASARPSLPTAWPSWTVVSRPLRRRGPRSTLVRPKLLGDHVDPARSNAYEQVGDGRRAKALAARWLRPKLIAGVLGS